MITANRSYQLNDFMKSLSKRLAESMFENNEIKVSDEGFIAVSGTEKIGYIVKILRAPTIKKKNHQSYWQIKGYLYVGKYPSVFSEKKNSLLKKLHEETKKRLA